MKKITKIIVIVIVTLLILLVIDTIQAKVFNNGIVIKITEEYNGGTLTKLNKGVLVATYFCSNGAKKTIFKWENYTCPSSEAAEENNSNKQNEISWEEITEDGINEELLLQNIDVDILNQIGSELQTLVNEAYAEERANPEIIVTEGWARILAYDRFKRVVDIGVPAMKPLYLIIYKSSNRGVYEYLCAYALYQISGYDFFWSTTDEFMEKFNEQILKEKQN